MRYPLHQITCQLAQLAALPFHQIDMGKQILVSHAVYHIDKPVGLAVQIDVYKRQEKYRHVFRRNPTVIFTSDMPKPF